MLLEVANLDAFYGDLQALHGLNIEVDRGESVALVGANGAGKTTFMRCLAGLIEQKRGAITFGGNDISRMPAEAIARRGIALVPEGRMLFPSLNVEENLLMGALGQRPGYWNLQRVFALFPLLAERRRQMPNTLSGGQQGLVAIGRALMANPDLLLCDEISLGLAPVAVDLIYASFARIRVEGAAIVVVEQDVKRAASATDRIYCLLEGRVTLQGGAGTRCRSADPRLFRHLRQQTVGEERRGIEHGLADDHQRRAAWRPLWLVRRGTGAGVRCHPHRQHHARRVHRAFGFIALGISALFPHAHPLLLILPVVVVSFLLGYALQAVFVNRSMRLPDPLAPLLLTFGLSVIVRNLMIEAFGVNPRHIQAGDFGQLSIDVFGVPVGVLPLVTLALAIALFVSCSSCCGKPSSAASFAPPPITPKSSGSWACGRPRSTIS